MLVSHKHKFVYLPPPRTGTTTIASVLVREFDARIYGAWKAAHLKATKHAIHLPEELDEYFVFASVRNPYARVISQFAWWRSHGQTHKRFRPFLEELLPRRAASLYFQLHQQPSYRPPEGCVKVRIDAMIRLENLQEDFQNLPFVSRGVDIPKLNRKDGRFDAVKYTRETAGWVRRYRRADFRICGYPVDCPRDLLRV
jgi:hypothetical protein